MPKSFKLNNDIYDIPDDKVSLFMSQFPDATEVQSFVSGQDTFDVPIQDVQRFVETVPGAKPLYFGVPESIANYEGSVDDLLESAVKEEVEVEQLNLLEKANLATGGFLGRKFPGMFKSKKIGEPKEPGLQLSPQELVLQQMGQPVKGDVIEKPKSPLLKEAGPPLSEIVSKHLENDPLTNDLMRIIFGEETEKKNLNRAAKNTIVGATALADLPAHILQTVVDDPVLGVAKVGLEFAEFAATTTNNIVLAISPTSSEAQRQKAFDNLYDDPAAPIFLALMAKGGVSKAKKWAEMSKTEKKTLIETAEIPESTLKSAQDLALEGKSPPKVDKSGLRRDEFVTEMRAEPPKQKTVVKDVKKTKIAEPTIFEKKPEAVAESKTKVATEADIKKRGELQKEQNELFAKLKILDKNSPEAQVIENKIVRMGDDIRAIDALGPEFIQKVTGTTQKVSGKVTDLKPVMPKTVEKPTVTPKKVETPVKPKVEPTSVKPEPAFKVGQTVQYQTGRMTKPRTGKISEIVSRDGKQTSFIIDKRPVQKSEVSLTNQQISARSRAEILKPFSKEKRKQIRDEAKEFDNLILENADLITERADQLHSSLFEGRESQKGIDIATGEFKRSLSEEFGKTTGIEDVGFSPVAKSKALGELKKLVDADKKSKTGIVDEVKALDEQTSVEFFDRLAKDDVVKKPVGTATLKVNKVDPAAVREVTNLKETLNNLTEQKNSPEFKNMTKIQQEKIHGARRKAAELLLEHKKLDTPGTESIILGGDVIPGAGVLIRAMVKWRKSKMNKADAKLRDNLVATQDVLYQKWTEGGRSNKTMEKQLQEISDAIVELDSSVKGKITPTDIDVISKEVKDIRAKDAKLEPIVEQRLSTPLGLKESGKEVLLKNTRKRNFEVFKANQKAGDWKEKLSDSDLKDIGSMVEGTGNLEILGDTIEGVKSRMTPAKQKVLNDYKGSIEKQRKQVNEHLKEFGEDEYIQFLDNYLPHFYTGSKKKLNNAKAKFLKNSPNAKARKIPTLQEAVQEYGLTPVTQNVADLYGMWSELNWRVATSKSYLGEMKTLLTEDGLPAIMPAVKAPSDWVRFSQPALRRIYGSKAKDGKVILHEGDIAVHPDLAHGVRQMVDSPFNNAFTKTVQEFNAWAKRASLSFSLFHHASLTESSNAVFASGKNPIRGLFIVGELDPLTGKRALITQPHRVGKRLLRDEKFLEDMIVEGGVQIGSTSDANLKTINKRLLQFEAQSRGNPMLSFMAKKFRQANIAWDKALWDNYHTGLKAYAYYDMTNLISKKYPHISPKEIKSTVGEFINDAFGGQEWEAHLWASPKTQQALNMAQLAPDWTYSNLRIAGKTFTEAKNPVRRRLQARYWRNMIPTLIGSAVGLQAAIYYAFGDEEKGDKPFIWDNERGKKFDIDVTPLMRELPWFDAEDKSRYYIHFGKQAREVIRFATNPAAALYSKSSPAVQVAMEQLFQVEGSEFPTEFGKVDALDRFPENIGTEAGLRIKAIASKFVPFSWRGNNFAFTAPMAKGMSPYKASVYISKILDRYANPVIFQESKHPKYVEALDSLVEDVLDAAELNGHDTAKIMTMALGEARGRYYKELFDAMEKFDGNGDPKGKQLKKMDDAAKAIIRLHAGARNVVSSAKGRGIKVTDAQAELLSETFSKQLKELGLD